MPVAGDVTPGELPAGRYARSVDVGPADGMVTAAGELQESAGHDGLAFGVRPSRRATCGGGRVETFHSDPREDGDALTVELTYRLA